MQLMLRDFPNSVPHIDLQGAFWSDREKPGEFGGFGVRITRDGIQSMSTSQFFEGLDGRATIDARAGSIPKHVGTTADVIVKIALLQLKNRSSDELVDEEDRSLAIANAICDAFDLIGVPEPGTMNDEFGDIYDRVHDALDALDGAEKIVATMEALIATTTVGVGAISATQASKLVAAAVAFHHQLREQYGSGLELEQVNLLCGSDHEQLAAALDDWEARLGMDVGELRSLVLPPQQSSQRPRMG